jgi:ATP-binding cassette, subfamily C (CFTR/MRP), member 1
VTISDPEATRTDAEIIEALQRAWLLPKDGPVDAAVEAKFSLNASVNDEGNFVDTAKLRMSSLT